MYYLSKKLLWIEILKVYTLNWYFINWAKSISTLTLKLSKWGMLDHYQMMPEIILQ